MIYLDNAATTKPTKEVVADVMWCLENVWGNPSSIHSEGIKARQILEGSRKKIANFINAETEEIIFTSSGTESNNLAIKGVVLNDNWFDCIITSKIEHPSVYNTCTFLNKVHGIPLEFVCVEQNGIIKPDNLRRLVALLSERKFCFVTIMLANNEIGTIQPIKEIAQIVHKYDGILHCDGTQAIGQIPIDVKELDCDLLSFSGHKLNCPKGIGVLYKKKNIKLSPTTHGGHQERNTRAGTENLPYIYALGNQLERIKDYPSNELRDYLYSKICKKCKDLNIEVQLNGDLINRLPNNLSLSFKGFNAEALITLLDMKGIYISAGSACSSGNPEPSRILKSIGLTDEEAFSTVRISLSKDTTYEECDEFIKGIEECLMGLKIIE